MTDVSARFDGLFAADPFAEFYNLNGFSSYAMTADIDWAPDYAVADMLEIFSEFGVKITCYATHRSTLLRGTTPEVEVGLHPDYTRPHPKDGFRPKLLELKDMFPDAVGVRSHRNFFGQNTAHLAAEAGLRYDSSVLLWRQPFCQIYQDQWGLYRLPYCWEDGIQADMRLPWTLDIVPTTTPGLKIFNIHPIFIYLNCPNDDYRRAIVKDYKDLTQAPRAAIEPQRFDGYGARRFLVDLLTELKATGAQDHRIVDIITNKQR
ncbi:hypothetical protein OIU35_11650 [Boseaceae bacterium BT-24-1]|nr:hypothetical protein [Boseaceae bacterium BT-24-1]